MVLIKDAIIEGLKELGRVILLAIVPVIIAGINATTGDISINFKLVLAVGLLALLRAVDKWLHETGKAINSESLAKGVTRF